MKHKDLNGENNQVLAVGGALCMATLLSVFKMPPKILLSLYDA